MSGGVVRVLLRRDPRWLVLLLVPALLAAGAVQPDAAVPRAGLLLTPGAPALLPFAAPVAEPGVAAPAGGHAPRLLAVRGTSPTSRTSRAARRSSRGARTVQERGQAALRALAYDPAALGYAIRFLPHRGPALGTTNRRTRLITVYVRPGQSELTLRTTVAHELGHALDFAHGTPGRRDAYRKARRLAAGPWFPCDRCTDFSSPAGDFAEVFATWLAGPGDFRSRLAGPPTAAQLRELAPLFAVPAPPVQARGAAAAPSPTPPPSEEPSGLPALLGAPPSPGPDRR